MNLKFRKEDINWIDEKYLSDDLADFWVNTDNNRLYCAKETAIGIAHYYFNRTELKWELDYFCENNDDDFKEDTGMVFNLKNLKTKLVKNNLYVIENNINMFKMKFSVEDTKNYFEQIDDIDIKDVNFTYLPAYVKAKSPLIAYIGDFKFIVFEPEFIKEYVKFSNSL